MPRGRIVQIALALLALAYVIAQFAAILRDSINWDELVLLSRAEVTLRTNVLQGGGRPGLGVAALVPFVDGCDSAMHVARTTRVVWIVITTALLLGVFELTRRMARRSPDAWHAAALATALLALVPLFLRWSLQVRTDQPAVAFALWASIALLASRERRWLGIVAGVFLGLGFLFSQKAVYIGALGGVLALGDLYIDRGWSWRRELARLVGFGLGAALALGAYKVGVMYAFTNAREYGLDEGLDLLKWYRAMLRYRIYGNMVTSILPHLALGALVVAAALRAMRADTAQRRPLTVSLVVILLGVGVARFHAASFPYFWITLGVFPAVAIGIGWAGIRELLPRAAIPITAAAWISLVVLGVRYRGETLEDTQQLQVESFAFAEQGVPAAAHGFQADGGLFCRRDGVQLPVFLGQNIAQRFGGADGPAHIEDFVAEHRRRPVLFLVWSPRFGNFPAEIQRFWREHYVPYRGVVHVAGTKVAGARGAAQVFEVLAPGRYRWWGSGQIAIAGRALGDGEEIELAAGENRAEIQSARADGILAWATASPPHPSNASLFDDRSLGEILGVRDRWW